MLRKYLGKFSLCERLMFKKVAIVGLGYVGLPLALAFGKKIQTVGFDINSLRTEQLKNSLDRTGECSLEDFNLSTLCSFTSEIEEISDADIFIITVPTPINQNKSPNLEPLMSASELVATVLSKGDYVVFESTVYPGATRELCVPIIETVSELLLNKDFFVGYSPERINPGLGAQKLEDIVKVTSGSTLEAAEKIDTLYAKIIDAGTYLAPSIEVAEAAKVIENTQRDVNIGLVNEFSIIFEKLGLETRDVLKAAGTKWNFLNFEPGLVGGHCIGVDPYYLSYKAELEGYRPELVLAGRRINESMAKLSVDRLVKQILQKNIDIKNAQVLLVGMTFKEDCRDLRNSKSFDLVNELNSFGINVDCYDPLVNLDELNPEIIINKVVPKKKYDAIIFAVRHEKIIKDAKSIIANNLKKIGIVMDLKSVLDTNESDLRL